MSFITKIQLGNLGYLDIDENVSVPLNFSVAEIQDISKRQGGYSKTIKLPGTKTITFFLVNYLMLIYMMHHSTKI